MTIRAIPRPAAILAAWLLFAAAAPGVAAAQEEPQISTWASGLEAPWDLAFLPDGRALVTERPGRVRVVASDGTVRPEPALTVPVGGGEGGLLGLALDPEFAANGLVYLYRTTPGETGNQVIRYRFDGSRLVSPATIVDAIPAATTHNGGRLAFGPDGFLYITTGDAQDLSLPQNPGSLAGKVLRLGSGAYRGAGGRPDVFTLGHRNPQGIDFQPGTGTPYASEHGPVGNDEVNRLVPGGNYGWPDATGPDHPAPFRSPVTTYTPAIAPSGATFVRMRGSTWTGSLLVAALRGQQVRRLVLEGDRALVDEPLFEGRFGRLRTVVEAPDGVLHVLTNNRDGRGTPRPGDDRVLRVVPPRSPDADLARVARQTPVTAFAGHVAWSAWDPAVGAFRLVLARPGASPQTVPVEPRSVPFDASLGPDSRDRPVLAYSRCRTEPSERAPGGALVRASGRGCDVHLFRIDEGREVRVRGTSAAGGSEFLPSVWRGEIAFARVFERRPGLRGRVPYVYVRRLSGGRSVRMPGGRRGSSGLPGPAGLDLYGSRLLLAWEWRDGDRLRSELRTVVTARRRGELLMRVGSQRSPANVLGPSGDRGLVVAGVRRVGGAVPSGELRAWRLSTGRTAGRREIADASEHLVSVAQDRGRTTVSTAAGPLAAPACGSPEQALLCGVRALGPFPSP